MIAVQTFLLAPESVTVKEIKATLSVDFIKS